MIAYFNKGRSFVAVPATAIYQGISPSRECVVFYDAAGGVVGWAYGSGPGGEGTLWSAARRPDVLADARRADEILRGEGYSLRARMSPECELGAALDAPRLPIGPTTTDVVFGVGATL